MQVYFIASSRLVEKDRKLYFQLYDFIDTNHKMVSDKVKRWLKMGTHDLRSAPLQVKRDNFEETMKCVNRAEIVIMEVSGHSMSMGYLICEILKMNKPVIALYQADYKPVFINGIVNSKLILVEYNKNNLEKIIEEAITKAKSLVDMRFNFFVSPKILNYLDWVAQKRMIPRSVFLRNLIEREMKKEKDFK